MISGSKEELRELLEYINLVNSIMELIDWYQLCDYCLEKIMDNYNSERILINEATISFVSNTSNLVKAAINSLKIKSNNEEYREKFEKYVSQIYDGYFSYRLLSRMRNYSQHCNFPVSVSENEPCFDLHQIYSTVNYTFNKTLHNEVDALMKEIQIRDNNTLKISLMPTVLRHMFCISKIYIKYIDYMKSILPSARKIIENMIEEQPELVEHPNNPGAYILFQLEEKPEAIHAIDLDGNLMDELVEARNKAVEKIKVIEKEIRKCTKNGMKIDLTM